MARLLSGILLLLVAFFSAYGAVHALSLDLGPVIGDRSLPYINRTLQPGLVAVLVVALLYLFAGLAALRGFAWRAWTWLGLLLSLVIVVMWAMLLWSPETRSSAYAAAGLVNGLVMAQVLVGVVALVIGPSGRSARRAGAFVIAALAAGLSFALAPDASAQSCPEGCVGVPGTPVVTSECYLFIFCDTTTVTPFTCMDANDTTAPCPADQPQEPPQQTGGGEQELLFVCPGNIGTGDPSGPTVVYDFTCQVVYAIVGRLIRELP